MAISRCIWRYENDWWCPSLAPAKANRAFFEDRAARRDLNLYIKSRYSHTRWCHSGVVFSSHLIWFSQQKASHGTHHANLTVWMVHAPSHNYFRVIPAQLGKLGAPYVMDFVLLWCIGRYLWEMKNLQILASNSVSFSRSGNLKFRGGRQ